MRKEDNIGKEIIVECSKEIVGKVYYDVISPSAEQIGKTVSLVFRAINVA